MIQHERQQHQLEQQNAALQLSLEHQQMNQHIQQQEASMAQQAHSRINQITTEAQAEILKHQQIAGQAQREIQRVTAAAEARCQDLARENEALRASPDAGYFDACPSEAGRAPSVASASPLNVVYCHVCGNQNVVGRGWCWNCKSSLEEPENGTDPFEPPSHERYMYPVPTRPSSVATIRWPVNIQRNIASREGPSHAEVPLPRAPGGPGPYGMPCGTLHDGSHVHHLGVDPRLVYGMSTPKAVSRVRECSRSWCRISTGRSGHAIVPKSFNGTGLPARGVHRHYSRSTSRGILIKSPTKHLHCDTSQEGVIRVWWWIRELGWFIRRRLKNAGRQPS